ncbi:MAG: hypothetical protein EA370_03670 [Wenzhouxiangella sp.]|nr:MAG: hypothetical protein EA370_03670 [Wenzhouxiangella sp.]
MPTLLLIDWEGAGWPLVHRLLDDGDLPHLAQLNQRAVIGPLTVPPPIQPWSVSTTLATGRLAIDHGILTPQAVDGSGLQPASSASLKAPFLWQILAARGRRSAAINWPLSYPAQAQAGLIVSDAFFQTRRSGGQLRPPPAHSAYPVQWQTRFARLRRHAAELSPAILRELIPDAGEHDWSSDARMGPLAVHQATTLSVADVALACLQDVRPDCLAVRFSAPATLIPLLFQAPPPFGQALRAVFQSLDRILGQLLEAAAPDSHVLLVSGYRVKAQRPSSARSLASRRDWYQDQGFLCAAGPRVQPRASLMGASVLDIVPTALRICRLDPGADMPGRVLNEILDIPAAPSMITSWNSCLPSSPPVAESEVLRGLLLESGQLAAPDLDRHAQAQALATAVSLAAAGRTGPALDMLERLGEQSRIDDPEYWRLLAHLSLDQDSGDEARLRQMVSELDRCGGTRFDGRLLHARIESRLGRHQQALDRLFESLAEFPENPTLHLYIGREYEHCGRPEDACQAYRNALQCAPGHHLSQLALARILLDMAQFEQALEAALDAVASRFNSAQAHWLLGQALEANGNDAHAAEAYSACLKLAPGLTEAHQRLLELYGPGRLDQADKLRQQQAAYGQLMAARAVRQAT